MSLIRFILSFAAGWFCVMLVGSFGYQFSDTLRPLLSWVSLNLGYSAPLFFLAALFVLANLTALLGALRNDEGSIARAFHLENRVDMGISLLFGIGVLFTAIGIRDALTAVISVDSAASDGSDILELLIDGGILSAMTTTVVGGAMGYCFRLVKVLVAGEKIEQLYARMATERHQRQEDLLSGIYCELQAVASARNP
ncbi:MAG: hypothetical protein VW684_11320 [Betaproteobacteria bacterium]